MQRNRIDPATESVFDALLSAAGNALKELSPEAGGSYAIALKTGGGKICSAASTDRQTDERIMQALIGAGETRVTHLVAVWKEGCLDIPSYALREKLLGLNKENENALLALQGEGCFVVRTVGSTVPAKKTDE